MLLKRFRLFLYYQQFVGIQLGALSPVNIRTVARQVVKLLVSRIERMARVQESNQFGGVRRVRIRLVQVFGSSRIEHNLRNAYYCYCTNTPEISLGNAIVRRRRAKSVYSPYSVPVQVVVNCSLLKVLD